jgi:transposase
MSLQPQPIAPVPEDTAHVARAAFPHGNLYIRLREELGVLYEDALLAPLCPRRGQPAEAPWRLALVTVMQCVEGLADRQAAEAVRSRIDWKYALGLTLTDPGFDFSVLSEFRASILSGGIAHQLLAQRLTPFKPRGLLKARGRQRTASTHVRAAIRTLNRLTGVGETRRHALKALATVAPDWLQAQITPAWFDRYSLRFDASRWPTEKRDRAALAATVGSAGFHRLTVLEAPTAPPWRREIPAVQLLRRVWWQPYDAPQPGEPVRWRAEADAPAAALLMHSPDDPEARYSIKRQTLWVGYKVHLTEPGDAATPHLITHVETTPATTQDEAVTATIHQALAARALRPQEHLVDTGYTAADHLVTSRTAHPIDLVGPVAPDTSWPARPASGFARAQFAIDWTSRRVTCPQGQQRTTWVPGQDGRGGAIIQAKCRRADCRGGLSRPQCTRSATQPRAVTFRPQAQQVALSAARQRQTTAAFQPRYAARAGVEGTLSPGVRACGLRRARYLGLAKTHLQHVLIAVAMNLVRGIAWFEGMPQSTTRTSRLAALATVG